MAWTWPIISPPEDYVEEGELFSKILIENAKGEVKTLLHLGCGGGHNDHTLKRDFAVTGVDLSEAMLELAGKLNPEAVYLQGDMRSVRLGRAFDAVAILDSINYMTTEQDLQAAFETAFVHLRPGGVFLTVVEETPERFRQNKTRCTMRSKGDVEICFIENYRDPDPADTSYEATFVWVIRRDGKLELEMDHHVAGIFALETWLRLLREAGFQVRQLKSEHSEFEEGEWYPLLVCVKPL